MSYKPTFVSGQWKAICDQCGRTFKSGELRMRWDNFMVCSGDWEPRHPQDFVRAIADTQAPPWTRPEGADVFVPIVPVNPAHTGDSTLNGQALNTIPLGG